MPEAHLDSLKFSELKKITIGISDVSDIAEQVRKESDRSCAIVLSETALSLLQQVFLSRMGLSEADGNVPSSLLRALGKKLLPQPIAVNLKSIFEIRNVFAHTPVQVSFSTASIAAKCNSLSLDTPKTGQEAIFETLDPNPPVMLLDQDGYLILGLPKPLDEVETPRERFEAASLIAIIYIILLLPSSEPLQG